MSHAISIPRSSARITRARPVTRVAAIAAFALLTAIGAKIALPLPFTPVPITLQTLFVLLAGVVLGGRDGAASQIAYVAMGTAGLPVFAGPGAGLPYLLGPTGGFLLAFPVAAWIAGSGIPPRAGAWRAATVLALATLVVLAAGAIWLARVLGVGIEQAIALGVLPFLPGGALKVAAATAIALSIRR
ncbi:MAG TPA: biotin transporter BioY [Gemmatimonadota bacterium]|nr:biotin transporter BioY [Gemmatimonadota bacterium]